MSHTPNTRNFWFRGSTLAFGGRISEPFSQTIDSQGSCVLPPTGGFAATSLESFSYRNIASFMSATSTVAGRREIEDGSEVAETMITVQIKGLRILDLITADAVVARIVSRYPARSSAPVQTTFGSHFENLRIGGVPLRLRARSKLMESASYADLSALQPQPTSAEQAAASHAGGSTALMAPLFDMDDQQAAQWPAGCKPAGSNGIFLPGLGTAYFGEYLVTQESRRLTMLRIELGCPIVGSVVMAYGDSNGHWYP